MKSIHYSIFPKETYIHTERKRGETYFATNDILSEFTEPIHSVFDLLLKETIGCKLRFPKPIVTHHSLLIGVRYCSILEVSHSFESLLEFRIHDGHKFISEPNSAHV